MSPHTPPSFVKYGVRSDGVVDRPSNNLAPRGALGLLAVLP